jgi:hypothetical protein
MRPSFTINVRPLDTEDAVLPQKGSRECRALDAPAASRGKKTRELVTTVTPETPGIPRAMVLTVSFALSSVTGLVCHRHRRNFFHRLDASVGASGPHDFAVRKDALSSVAHLTSIASRPYVRDDRETPLCVGGMAADIDVIWVKWEQEYFFAGDWTTQIKLNPKENFSLSC